MVRVIRDQRPLPLAGSLRLTRGVDDSQAVSGAGVRAPDPADPVVMSLDEVMLRSAAAMARSFQVLERAERALNTAQERIRRARAAQQVASNAWRDLLRISAEAEARDGVRPGRHAPPGKDADQARAG